MPGQSGKKGLYAALAVAFIGASIVVFTRLSFRMLPGSFFNQDRTRNIYELIESRGFEYEKHFVTTKSGYILQLVRVVNPHVKDKANLKPVLLFHGFQCTGTLWLVASNGTLDKDGHYYEYDQKNQRIDTRNMVGNTLGFVLATRGYDVWLANYRGSLYSTNHTTLDTKNPEFWSFSIDDMIEEDLPALVTHVQQVTKRKSISYIGHSQGTFVMFGLLSKRPEFAKVIKPFIALSPVVYTTKTSSPVITYVYKVRYLLRKFPKRAPILDYRKFLSSLAQNTYTRKMAYGIHSFAVGSQEKNIDMNRLGVFTNNIGMGSSSWNWAHWEQMLSDGMPRHFDYGKEQNLAKYGTEKPPIYDLSKINSEHIALFYTANDWFNHLDDVSLLKDALKVKLLDDYQVPDASWNHMELTWGTEVGKYVNSRVLDILSRY